MWLSGKESICLSMQELGLPLTQSYLTLCDPMDCSLPGSSVHGILKARILEWVAIPFSRGSSWPRDQTQVSCIAGRCFTIWATREAHQCKRLMLNLWIGKIPRDNNNKQQRQWRSLTHFRTIHKQILKVCSLRVFHLRTKSCIEYSAFPP